MVMTGRFLSWIPLALCCRVVLLSLELTGTLAALLLPCRALALVRISRLGIMPAAIPVPVAMVGRLALFLSNWTYY